MFLMCVFVSPFYTSSPVWFFLCHFLDLRFLSSLLSVSVSSSFSPSSLPAPYLEHMTVFFLFCGLLARCCLVRHLSKQNGQKHSIEQSKTLSAESAPCFLLPSFSSWCRWTPPTRLGQFFWQLFCCPFGTEKTFCRPRRSSQTRRSSPPREDLPNLSLTWGLGCRRQNTRKIKREILGKS